jgi:hypothetical protein
MVCIELFIRSGPWSVKFDFVVDLEVHMMYIINGMSNGNCLGWQQANVLSSFWISVASSLQSGCRD